MEYRFPHEALSNQLHRKYVNDLMAVLIGWEHINGNIDKCYIDNATIAHEIGHALVMSSLSNVPSKIVTNKSPMGRGACYSSKQLMDLDLRQLETNPLIAVPVMLEAIAGYAGEVVLLKNESPSLYLANHEIALVFYLSQLTGHYLNVTAYSVYGTVFKIACEIVSTCVNQANYLEKQLRVSHTMKRASLKAILSNIPIICPTEVFLKALNADCDINPIFKRLDEFVSLMSNAHIAFQKQVTYAE